MVVVEGGGMEVDVKFWTFAGKRGGVTKIEQVRTRGEEGGPNFGHFVRT